MAKGTIGAVTAVLVWFGAATAAEAQIDVTITGPSNVVCDQTSMVVTTTSNTSNFMYWVKVHLNGVQKHYSGIRSASGYGFSWTVVNMNTWPLVENDALAITVRAWTSATNFEVAVSSYTVGPPGGGTYAPANDRRFQLPGMREESYAWLRREDLGVNA